MKRIFPILSLLFVLPCMAEEPAEAPAGSKLDEYMEAGMEVGGVRIPYYDGQGNLQGELYGGRARVVNARQSEVHNLRIDVFKDGSVFMTVYAPYCTTEIGEEDNRKILSVQSDGEVLISMEQITIAGRGFRFSSNHNRFEILHDAKVLVKENAREIRELGL